MKQEDKVLWGGVALSLMIMGILIGLVDNTECDKNNGNNPQSKRMDTKLNTPMFLPSIKYSVEKNMFKIRNPNRATMDFLNSPSECPSMKSKVIDNLVKHDFVSTRITARNKIGKLIEIKDVKMRYDTGSFYSFSSCINKKNNILIVVIEETRKELLEMKKFNLGKNQQKKR